MPRREGPGRLAARNDPWPVDGPPIQGQHKRVGCLSRFASRRAATTGSSSQDGERCSGIRIGRGWPNRTSCSTLQSRSPLTGRRSPATSPCLRCGPLSPNMSDGSPTRKRTGQGHLGSRGHRPSRQPVVHRNPPALAGSVRQTVGSRTTPATTSLSITIAWSSSARVARKDLQGDLQGRYTE